MDEQLAGYGDLNPILRKQCRRAGVLLNDRGAIDLFTRRERFAPVHWRDNAIKGIKGIKGIAVENDGAPSHKTPSAADPHRSPK